MAVDLEFRTAFDVISCAEITLLVPRRRDWGGRSHSLWYCDAVRKGEFRWFEVAFMGSPFKPPAPIVPFSLAPDGSAAEPFSPGAGGRQVAWGPTPIDQGSEGEFVERWMAMFAEAALGRLDRPSTLPEPNQVKTWRRQ